MQSIKKILVPVVFTDTSRHVVQQAAWLARRFHAELILLHVVTPLSYLQTLTEVGAEKNNTIVFPLPVDIIRAWLHAQENH